MCASTLIGQRADETASDFSDRTRSKLNDLCVVKKYCGGMLTKVTLVVSIP